MADYTYIQETGTIIPDTGDILTEVQNEFKDVFGADLVTTPDTPQGVLMTAFALARDSIVRNNAALANQINPNLAGGVFLDAIWALTGGARAIATRSTVTGQLTGVPSTLIPAGSRAQTTEGDLFETTGDVSIIANGTAEVEFRSVEYGPIPALSGTLTQIITGIVGWETVTNADNATLGVEEQSDQSVRALRRNTLALQGVALPEAIVSGLYMTEGVRSLSFRENVTDSPITIDGVSLDPHSIYVCVDGGTDMDVATTLLNNKSLGCGWNGGVTVDVLEPFSGQEYEVKFSRPTEVEIDIRVTIRASTQLTDPAQDVKDAIMAYVNGEQTGEPGFTVGNDVSSFELASAINRVQPLIYVQKVEIKTGADPYSTDEIEILISEIAVTDETNITVVVV
jgi:uncharacterized phage protein gp47/JayE